MVAATVSLFSYPAHATRTELKTHAITQQTPVWCWAATAGMALELLGFPDINPAKNYQCGVVTAAFPECDDDCSQCITALPSMERFVAVLTRYSDLSLGQDSTKLKQAFKPNYVAHPAWTAVKNSIDHSFPVIAGISPGPTPVQGAEPKHAILITGYDDDYRGTGEVWVTLRDPYPYLRRENPYTAAGYAYQASSRKVRLPWRALRDRLNLISAVFLEDGNASGRATRTA